MMAPVFSNLSVKYSAAVFLTVDVEKCQVSNKWSVIHCFFCSMQRETDNEEGLCIQPLYRLATHMQKPCIWCTSAVDLLTEDQTVKLDCV